MRVFPAFAALATFLAAGCVRDAPRPAASIPPAVHGRAMFEVRCGTCHGLPDPVGCTPAVMDSMASMAGLIPEERAAIDAYLATVRK